MDKPGAFLQQAQSDFRVFEELWARGDEFPICHALHHLQMATEKLSKSLLQQLGVEINPKSHAAFREVLQYVRRPDVAKRLGYKADAQKFKRLLDRRAAWFREIERLSPSIGTDVANGGNDGPNVEYPWEARDASGVQTWIVPSEHDFPIAAELRSLDGYHFILMIRALLDRLPDAIQR